MNGLVMPLKQKKTEPIRVIIKNSFVITTILSCYTLLRLVGKLFLSSKVPNYNILKF